MSCLRSAVLLLTVLMILDLLFPARAKAVVVVDPVENVILFPEADAAVSETQPDDPVGNPDFLYFRTRTDAPGRHEVTYLRFPLGDVHGRQVANASLAMTAAQNINDLPRTTLLFGITEEQSWVSSRQPWDELTIGYSTAPGIFPDDVDPMMELSQGANLHQLLDVVPPEGTTVDSNLLPTLLSTTDVVLETDLPGGVLYDDASIADFINQAIQRGDASITFAIHSSGNSQFVGRLYSKDALVTFGGAPVTDEFKPHLRLTMIEVPEPTTVAMACVGILTCIAWRRV